MDFFHKLFNATFKTNPYLERALITGITRVSSYERSTHAMATESGVRLKSPLSGLDSVGVYGTSASKYMTCCGFTEEEVSAALDEYGIANGEGVRAMYDGYTFGTTKGIYNPWPIVNYLQIPQFRVRCDETRFYALAKSLISEGGAELKQEFLTLLQGGSITARIDEHIVYDKLDNADAVWSLLLAVGYLTSVDRHGDCLELRLPNGEVRKMFERLVSDWFAYSHGAYHNFLKALMLHDLDFMNDYMNDVAASCFSSFDTGGTGEKSHPERFYHGFVLGLLVDLRDRYVLTSNPESGLGRYDVMLEPRNPAKDDAFIFEFKVHRPKTEASLEDTVAAALAQIEAKGYEQQLVERGIPKDRIHKYGFAFKGKEVLIG